MADEQDPYFEVEGRRYPMPQSFRLGDPVLVTQLTGMQWSVFVDALDDPDRAEDPIMLLGLIAVSVWQGNPRWTRERCARYVEQLDIGAVRVDAPETDAVPPTSPGTAPASSSGTSPETPNATQESVSDPTPPSSGQPGLDTGVDSGPVT